MQDIIILERCSKCNDHLILRESINVDSNKTFILKFCKSNCIPVEEIIEVINKDYLYINIPDYPEPIIYEEKFFNFVEWFRKLFKHNTK